MKNCPICNKKMKETSDGYLCCNIVYPINILKKVNSLAQMKKITYIKKGL